MVTKKNVIAGIVKEYGIDIFYHMAAILSVAGEANPLLAWDVNINDTYNILEIARENNLDRIFVPSYIAIFGPETHIERAHPKTRC